MRLVLILLALVAAGCTGLTTDPFTGLPTGGSPVAAPSESPDLRGTVKELTSGNDGGTLLVEDAAAARTRVQLASTTALIRPDGQRLSFREFEVGQTVEVWFDGAPTAGDPRQVKARAVRQVR